MRRASTIGPALAVLAVIVPACGSGGDSARSEGRYCTEVGNNLEVLVAPTIATPTQVAATVRLHRSIATIAPLAIEPEWNTLVIVLEAAADVDPDDPASVQLAADTARMGQSAYTSISDYTSRLCGLTIGTPTPSLPLPTAAPDPAPTTTTG